MNPSLQICVVAFAMALCYLLQRQLPTVTALRWWLYVWALAWVAPFLQLLATAPSAARFAGAFLTIATLAGCAQVYFVGRGLLCRKRARQTWVYMAVALGICFVIAVAISVGLNAHFDRAVIASYNLAPAVFSLILGINVEQENCGWPRRIVSLPLIIFTIAASALVRAVDEVGLLPGAAPAGTSFQWSSIAATCAAALAMLHLALAEAHKQEAEERTLSEQIRGLVNSTGHGICDVDPNGVVTFANPAAAAMFGAAATEIVGMPIGQFLQPSQDASSAEALTDFLLRPTRAVAQAKAQIRRFDGSAISAELSVSPVLRNEQPTGAVLMLRDISQDEAAGRFANVRTQLLEMIAHNVALEDISKALAQAVEERLPGFYCSIILYEGESFVVVASPTLPDVFQTAMAELSAGNIRQGDIADWQELARTIAVNDDSHRTWTEPMISSANQVMGAVVLNHHRSGPLSSEEMSIVREAARLGAMAIERHRSFERLLHQGHHDALTGLPNRLLLADRLKQALARARRTGAQVALMCIDLDRFKYVNDTFGHDCGDVFLQQISARLAARIRSSDTLARTGGDEFTAIVSDIRDVQDARKIAEALICSLADPFDVEGHTLYGAASIGIAIYPQHGTDADTLQRNADRAMYRAKAQGSNTIEYHSSADAHEGEDRMEIELHLHRAIEQGHFSLNYQPQFTCDHRLTGFEALLRFRHPKLGPVPPSRFIPVAEESGLIVPIGEWVLHETCRQIAEWQKAGMRPIRVAVNVSPLQFGRPDFAETVARALRATGIKPQQLELEVTEGVLMKSGQASDRQVDTISRLGVRMSVDDFGTGYSSLSYLHQLPIQVLKVDRSFVAHMLEPSGTRSIVDAIISLAHGLGMETVAEGVETEEQLRLLQAAGCDLIQGFLFSHPLSAVDASRLLWQETMTAHPSGVDQQREPHTRKRRRVRIEPRRSPAVQ